MEDTKFYPLLTDILPLANIPNNLGFIKEGVEYLTSGIHYTDFHVEKSIHGDSAFYFVNLILLKKLGFEVPGTDGLALVLNPDLAANNITSIPISLSYQWDILRYAEGRSISDVITDPSVYFNLFLDLANTSEKELLREFVSVVIDDPDPVLKFISDYNAVNAATQIVLSPDFNVEEKIDIIVKHIEDLDQDIFEIVLSQLLSSFNSIDVAIEKTKRLFQSLIGAITEEDIERLLIPRVRASINSIRLALEFPRSVFQPLLPDGTINPDEQIRSQLSFDVGSVSYSTETGFEFVNESSFDFTKSMILNSGLTLELHDMKLDLSRTKNIPEATADGRPLDFVGVYVKDGTISFPAFWNQDPDSTGIIKARKLLVGTGGFSGTFSMEAKDGNDPAPLVKIKFGKDFSISLDAFSITLKQNAIIDSTIEGTLVIPGFKDANNNPAEIRIKVAIRQDGDFDITAHEDDGFKDIVFPNVFNITLKSVFFGKKDDDFYLGISGSIKFTNQLLLSLAPVEVEKLLIWSDGRFEIEGGAIPLPKNLRFPIGPAELSISAIHLGSHQRVESNGTTTNFRYFGFDGGIDINPGGVDVRGKGIKFYFPLNGDISLCYLEIKSINIDLVIPGSASKENATALISGFLSVGGTASAPEYEGGVSFSLPKAKISGGASIKYRPKTPAFIVDAFVELSTPIPLGSTSLGIYGFRGLFGQRYVATKQAAGLSDDKTWFDYYKALTPPENAEGVNISKFETPDDTKDYDNPFSIGAGVSLATSGDDGKTFSMKLFFMLSLPELIYLEGKANILGERVGLTGEDPQFFAVLAISSQSVETGFGVNYKLPREGGNAGWILDLKAEMRAAFFFKNSSAWYINFGTIQNPTTARVLSLFDATAYVMLSAAGIAAGAGVTWGFDKSYAGGLVHASVDAYIKVGGFISFERPQIGGFAMLGGHVDARLMGISFHVIIDTSLSVEASEPFFIQGKVHLCIGVTIGFKKFSKKIEKCFDVEFKWEKNPNVNTDAVLPFADDPAALPPLKATNMLSGESFNIVYLGTSPPSGAPPFDQAVLPLDSWVDIEFLKGLLPSSAVDERIGRLSGQAPTNYIDLIPPAQVVHKVQHEYSIKAVEIKAWSGSAWVDYRPYQAMSPPDALVALNANPSEYKDGFWQNSGAGFNKLRLLAETSLSYMQQGQPGWYIPEQFGITSATLFCPDTLREQHCIRWIGIASGTVYPDGAWQQIDTVLCRVSGSQSAVIDWPNHLSIPRSLVFANEATAQIVFNKPCAEVNLKLTTFSTGAVIRFYKRETQDDGFVYTLLETRSLSQLQLLAPVKYNNATAPVAKVEIDPINADAATVYALQVQIDSLYRRLYEETPPGPPSDKLMKSIRALEAEVAEITGRGCTPNGIEETLVKQLPIIQRQIDDCLKQLAALEAEQQKACKKAADFSALFARCFPKAPALLSYEIIERSDLAGRAEFVFRVYDDRADTILFDGTQPYADALTAERAVFDTLELGLWLRDYALMAPKREQLFLQIVDVSGRFAAISPARFTRWDQLVVFWKQINALLLAAHAGGRFALARRSKGKLVCDESLEHLECWNKLSAFGEVGPRSCQTIVASILSARDVYCSEYHKLYRALYDCNKQLLDEAIRHCEELTHQLDLQHQTCQALSDQLAAILQLISFIEHNGALPPPEGFPCSTLLHEVCCLSLEDYQFNISIPSQPAIAEDYANAVQAIEKRLAPVWRPHQKYYIRLQLNDTVNGSPTPDRNFYFGFRTAGPLGFFHEDQFANYVAQGKTPDQYILTSLKGYIDYRRSYPDPSGQLIGAKPLFYEDARILLFFTKRYVYHFFGDWPAYNGLPALNDNAMQIIIKDPSEDISFPNPPPPLVTTTVIPQAVVSWPTDKHPRIAEDIRTLLNLRNPELLNPDFTGGNCWETGGEMIKPASVYTSVTPQYLKPLKLYTAIVNNVYDSQIREVHRFGFQTSSYPDFAAQVNSYHLDDGKGYQRDAIFRIDVPLSVPDIILMHDIVTGNMSAPNAALSGTFADSFDRLVEGVMKLTPLDAAISTEFNIVRNSTTNAVVAVWIRNPEPFNDPKLPDDVLKRSLRVMNGLNPDLSYDVLFSKDGSQAFVMHPSKTIPVTQMKFRFAYIEWDGSDYVDHAVVVSGLIHTNI
ncbi:MAG TPA: hypothetical protein VF131_10110 [Blastocatellia bacterium]|nr:hypothetical protein [Blastocatellia bacterium]